MMPLIEQLKKALVDTGTSEDDALDVVERIIRWGAANGASGEYHYWPGSFRPLTPPQRAEGIRADFKGNNLKEICAKYCVSARTVYRIVRG